MSDLAELDLIKSYLAKPDESRSPEEVKAFGDFFLVYEPIIQDIIKDCADSRVDERDLFQEVWLTLTVELRELTYDPDRGPLRAWILVVARRAAIRGARRLRRNRADALTPELAEVLVDPRPDPMTQYEQEEERQWVRSILATLPELTHRIMVLRWIDGLSVPEVSASLGLSGNRIRMRLHRARNKLRNFLGHARFMK